MTLQELDVIVRVAGATLLLVATALMCRRVGHRLYFILLAGCLCGFLAGNTPDPVLRLTGAAGDVAHLLSGFAAVSLWWFCLAVFDRSFKPRGLVLAASAAWIVVASADRGVFGSALANAGLSRLLIVLGFGMVGHLAWRLTRDREGDLIDDRRSARGLVVLLLAGQLFADLMVDLFLGLSWRPQAFSIIQNAVLLVFTAWLLRLSLQGNAHSRRHLEPAPSHPFRSPSLSASEAKLHERLGVLIHKERVQLDPTLSFGRFVAMMGGSERAVRRLINRQLGYDHFRTFLNAHRMDEARRLLADPARNRDKLIVIAMDSGFASLASFNRVFQETENCTPSAFRDLALSKAAPASAIPPSPDRRSAASF